MHINFNKYKAVLFDFDCTLYAPCHLGVRIVFNDIPHMFVSKRERNVKKALVGKDFGNAEAFYKEFFRLLGEKNREWYFNSHLPLMVRLLKKIGSRPKAQAMIEHLQQKGLKVGVFSDYPMVKERCEAIGVNVDEKHMWCSEDFGCLKPAPRPFTEIAKQVDLDPSEILFVGDRADTDYEGATKAGMSCILVDLHDDKRTNGAPVFEWNDIVNEALAL